jgi:tRNA(adenine34) deaminase
VRTRTDEEYMQDCLDLAAQTMEAFGEFPIAAVVVLDGQTIAQGTTHEKREGRYLLHAELEALDAADRLKPFPGRRWNARLFTNLEPCLMCLGAAMSFGVGEIVYALESEGDGAVALVQSWERAEEDIPGYRVPTISGGLLRRESMRLFEEYVRREPAGPMRDWAASVIKP